MHYQWGSIKYKETRTIILHHIPMPVLIIAKNNFCDNPWKNGEPFANLNSIWMSSPQVEKYRLNQGAKTALLF